MSIYKAINDIQKELNKEGITKDRKNQQQGYSFRGIDDVYNALAPLLAKFGVCILPRVLSRHNEWRETQKGGNINYVVVDMEFDFICSEDGSKHTCRMSGEAMDSADKATNKAMSAAYKYAAFQAFAIPTEGDNDADSTTHTPVNQKLKAQPKQGGEAGNVPKSMSDTEIAVEVAKIDNIEHLRNWYNKHSAEFAPGSNIVKLCEQRKAEITAAFLREKNNAKPCPEGGPRQGQMISKTECEEIKCPMASTCPNWV